MQSSLTVIVPDNKNQLIFLKAINGQSVSLGKDRVAVAPSSLVCLAWLSGIQVWQTPGDSLNSGPQFPCQLSNTEVVCWRTPVLCNTAILDNELVAHYQPRCLRVMKSFCSPQTLFPAQLCFCVKLQQLQSTCNLSNQICIGFVHNDSGAKTSINSCWFRNTDWSIL